LLGGREHSSHFLQISKLTISIVDIERLSFQIKEFHSEELIIDKTV
jgi:hypothetical protein